MTRIALRPSNYGCGNFAARRAIEGRRILILIFVHRTTGGSFDLNRSGEFVECRASLSMWWQFRLAPLSPERQRSPMHMKIAFGADLIFACAGCDAGKSFASVTRNTILSTNGNFNAVRTVGSEPFPVTTISAPLQARIQCIEKRNVAKHVSLG